MKYDAFISYRRESGFLMAQVISDRLKEKGIQCFLDLEELRSGHFDEKILVAIREAHSFILILPKNALNRCKNEEDWVRKEILEAVRCDKTIIPVMYDGFTWPKIWNPDIPLEIQNLESMNGVSGSQEYLPAMVDKIISFMPQNVLSKKIVPQRKKIAVDTITFFKNALTDFNDNISVDMAFHAGADWRQSSEKVNLLNYFIKHKIKLRILVNEESTVEKITENMRQPLKRYVGYNNNLSDWYQLSQEYQDIIAVRVLKVPMFHRIYLIRGADAGIANVKYYTYGNYMPEKDFRLSFQSDSLEYKLYADEFEYLWNDSDEYEPNEK